MRSSRLFILWVILLFSAFIFADVSKNNFENSEVRPIDKKLIVDNQINNSKSINEALSILSDIGAVGTTNFGGWTDDYFLQLYVPEVDGIMYSIDFNLSDVPEESGGSLSVQIFTSKYNWQEINTSEIVNVCADANLGYYDDGSAYVIQGSNWIKGGINNIAGAVSDRKYDPLGNSLWPSIGVGTVILATDIGLYNLNLDDSGGSFSFSKGDSFIVVVKLEGFPETGANDEYRIGFYSSYHVFEDRIQPDIKFYNNNSSPDGRCGTGDYGWYIRNFIWDWRYNVEITSDRAPLISNVSHELGLRYDQDRKIMATITDDNPSEGTAGVSSVNIFYSADEYQTELSVSMTLESGDVYSAYIPAQSQSGIIEYYIVAEDVNGLVKTTKKYNYFNFDIPDINTGNIVLVIFQGSFGNGILGIDSVDSWMNGTEFSYDVYPYSLYGNPDLDFFNSYNTIFEIHGDYPDADLKDLIESWLNLATIENPRYYYLESQDIGYFLNGTEDLYYEPGSFYYDYLGVEVHGPQDIASDIYGSTKIGGNIFDPLSGEIAQMMSDGTEFYYFPKQEWNYKNYIDHINPTDFSQVIFTDETGNAVGVRNEATDGSWATAFLAFNTAAISVYQAGEYTGNLFNSDNVMQNAYEYWNGMFISARDVTSIHDIQYNETIQGEDGNCFPSVIVDSLIKIQGTVTGVDSYGFYMQDSSEIWSGIYVYTTNKFVNLPEINDSVSVIGTVAEYSGLTEIKNPIVTSLGKATMNIDPTTLTTGLFSVGCEATAEAYEGTLIKLTNVTVTQEANQYGIWYVDDGSGQCPIGVNIFPYSPAEGDFFDSIIGVVRDGYGEYRITPRKSDDFSPLTPRTITFQADLMDFINNNWFNPSDPADSIVVNGSFNGWNSNSKMVPKDDNSNIYTHTIQITADPGEIIEWKFKIFPESHWNNTGWENGANRQTVFSGNNMILNPEVPNCEYAGVPISQDVTVTFSVSMTNAVNFHTDVHFENIKSVYINGDFCTESGWTGWALSDTLNLIRLFDDGVNGGDVVAGDNIWTTNVLFPAGSGREHSYKYAAYDPDNMDFDIATPMDNEAGYDNNHTVTLDDQSSIFIVPDAWATKKFDLINIAEARSGTDGDIVSINGIVTTPNFGTPGGNSQYVIQDETAGIFLWNGFFDADMSIGDNITVTGALATYGGKREIIPGAINDIIVISGGNELPAFQELTISDILSDPEAYESELVKISNVIITDGVWPNAGENSNLLISNIPGDTVFTMRIDKETDIDENAQPIGSFSVQGIINQYDTSAPFTDAYQIWPRFYSDILTQENVTSIQDVSITFSVDMSSYDGTPTDVSLQGQFSPLDWSPGSNLMSDLDGDGIYTIDIIFPTSTNKNIEYKYTAYSDTNWNWENFTGNRVLKIDDSHVSQVLKLDYWGYQNGRASAYFDGISARIRITDSYPVNPDANSDAYMITGNAITVEAWVFPLSLPGEMNNSCIISRPYWNSEPWAAYALRINNKSGEDNPKYEFTLSDGTVPWNGVSLLSSETVEIGQWNHLVGTYDGTTAKLYVDGQLVNEAAYSENIGLGNTGLYIGGNYGGNFHGLIDEVCLWNITRSQQEIQNDMIIPPDILTTELVGYWPLNESVEVNGNSPVTIDLTDNHNDLWVQHGAYFIDAFPPEGEPNIPPNIRVVQINGVLDEYLEYSPQVIGWPTPSVSLVAGPDGMTLENGVLQWTPNAPYWYEVILEAVNDFGSVQETFPIWIDGASVSHKEHDNNNILFSVFNNGILGIDGGVEGVGFQFDGANGLYEGTVFIGRTNDQVSGVLYHREFSIRDSIKFINSYLTGFDQAFEAKFNDLNAPNPINIEITQRSHSKSTNPDDDYVIMDYEILNNSGADLNDIYIGLEMDWDVGIASNNVGGYDSQRKLSYIFEADGPTNPNYYGMAALSDDVSGHFLWINGSIGDESSDNFLYQCMQSFSDIPTDPGDLRTIIAMGPYTIPMDQSTRATFALLGGENLPDLQANADAALATDLEEIIPELSHFSPIYYGNPYLAMNLYITGATLEGTDLSNGDEIGIFDGNYCVGAGIVVGAIDPFLALVASTDEPGTPEIDGFTPGHKIRYRLWDSSEELEVSNVAATYSLGVGTFSSQGTVSLDLEGFMTFEQEIDLNTGWNIMSFNTQPVEMDLSNIAQSLIDNNSLLKIQDETGSAIEKLPFGWINSIGSMSVSEGYYIKVSSNQVLVIEGNPVDLPIDIFLDAGWNIMGYPVASTQDAMSILQPLIDEGELLKVQDETGAAIEELPFGWVNNINNFEPGEGYYVKVSATTSVNINKPSKSAPLTKVLESGNKSTHFIPPFEANPYLAMNVYVLDAILDEKPVKEGIEIGVFDGEICVGSSTLIKPLKPSDSYLSIIVSTDDPFTEEVDGFISGNSISFRLWDGENEYIMSVRYYPDSEGLKLDKFVSQGTMIVELNGKTLPKDYKLYACYPNPFNPTTTIRYDLPDDSRVNLLIYDLRGRLTRTLLSEHREAGYNSIIWDGKNDYGRPAPSGIYFYQLKAGSFSQVRKMVLVK